MERETEDNDDQNSDFCFVHSASAGEDENNYELRMKPPGAAPIRNS
jgi:hypothetical protein